MVSSHPNRCAIHRNVSNGPKMSRSLPPKRIRVIPLIFAFFGSFWQYIQHMLKGKMLLLTPCSKWTSLTQGSAFSSKSLWIINHLQYARETNNTVSTQEKQLWWLYEKGRQNKRNNDMYARKMNELRKRNYMYTRKTNEIRKRNNDLDASKTNEIRKRNNDINARKTNEIRKRHKKTYARTYTTATQYRP